MTAERPRASRTSSVSSASSAGGDHGLELHVVFTQLSDLELRILESALLVQLEVAKLARKKNARKTVVIAIALHMIMPLKIFSIAKKKKLRKLYTRLAEQATAERVSRRLDRGVVDAQERAVVAVGFTNDNAGCALSFAPEILLDQKVLHAVCEAFMHREGDFLQPHHTIRKLKPTLKEQATHFVGRLWSQDKDKDGKDREEVETIEVFGEDPTTALCVRRLVLDAVPVAVPIMPQPSAPEVDYH